MMEEKYLKIAIELLEAELTTLQSESLIKEGNPTQKVISRAIEHRIKIIEEALAYFTLFVSREE